MEDVLVAFRMVVINCLLKGCGVLDAVAEGLCDAAERLLEKNEQAITRMEEGENNVAT